MQLQLFMLVDRVRLGLQRERALELIRTKTATAPHLGIGALSERTLRTNICIFAVPLQATEVSAERCRVRSVNSLIVRARTQVTLQHARVFHVQRRRDILMRYLLTLLGLRLFIGEVSGDGCRGVSILLLNDIRRRLLFFRRLIERCFLCLRLLLMILIH